MKNYFFALLSFALTLSIFHASAQNRRSSEVRSFNKIDASGVFNIEIRKGDVEEVILEGDEKLIDRTIVEVRGSTLYIYLKDEKKIKNWNSDVDGEVDIYITYKELTRIENSGVNKLKVVDKVKAEDFTLICSGAGSVEMGVSVETISVVLSGAGHLKLWGYAESQDIEVSGAGKVDALDMQGSNASVSISGVAEIKVHVSDRLSGHLSGMGNVTYKGDPSTQVQVSGFGNLRRI